MCARVKFEMHISGAIYDRPRAKIADGRKDAGKRTWRESRKYDIIRTVRVRSESLSTKVDFKSVAGQLIQSPPLSTMAWHLFSMLLMRFFAYSQERSAIFS